MRPTFAAGGHTAERRGPWRAASRTFLRLELQTTALHCIRCIRCSAEQSADHRSAAFYNPVAHMDLKRRLAKLETVAVSQGRRGPVFSEEDRAIMQRMINRWYADPERYARYIKSLDEAKARLEARGAG